MYSMMSCSGWPDRFAILGSCSMSWFAFVIIVFLCLVLKRQADDGFLSGMGFNIYGAFGFGLGTQILITTLTGSARWSLLGGLLGVVIGGFVLGLVFNTSSGGESE